MLINRRQQSTAGWNIWTTLLDVTGGVLSISQLLLDATLTHDVGKVRAGELDSGLRVSIRLTLVPRFMIRVSMRAGSRVSLRHSSSAGVPVTTVWPRLESNGTFSAVAGSTVSMMHNWTTGCGVMES